MSDVWRGRRVLVTGHTGFKGSWLSLWLSQLGATVYGLALEPDTEPHLFGQLRLDELVDHAVCDIRDEERVKRRLEMTDPEIVFHLAAQPLVLDGYKDPLATWRTNVEGSVHLLEALRTRDRPCAVVMVTTDKVYENRETKSPYRENDRLGTGGGDPYSASKVAMEVAVASWRDSFFSASGRKIRMAAARAGNVLGGGDWAADRLLPDIVRSLSAGKPVMLRNPEAIRPWQHVLECLGGYLHLAERLLAAGDPRYETAWNFGPEPAERRTVREVVEEVFRHWPGEWQDISSPGRPHEAHSLTLSIERSRAELDFNPRWNFAETVSRTVDWYRQVADGGDAREVSLGQIESYDNI